MGRRGRGGFSSNLTGRQATDGMNPGFRQPEKSARGFAPQPSGMARGANEGFVRRGNRAIGARSTLSGEEQSFNGAPTGYARNDAQGSIDIGTSKFRNDGLRPAERQQGNRANMAGRVIQEQGGPGSGRLGGGTLSDVGPGGSNSMGTVNQMQAAGHMTPGQRTKNRIEAGTNTTFGQDLAGLAKGVAGLPGALIDAPSNLPIVGGLYEKGVEAVGNGLFNVGAAAAGTVGAAMQIPAAMRNLMGYDPAPGEHTFGQGQSTIDKMDKVGSFLSPFDSNAPDPWSREDNVVLQEAEGNSGPADALRAQNFSVLNADASNLMGHQLDRQLEGMLPEGSQQSYQEFSEQYNASDAHSRSMLQQHPDNAYWQNQVANQVGPTGPAHYQAPLTSHHGQPYVPPIRASNRLKNHPRYKKATRGRNR